MATLPRTRVAVVAFAMLVTASVFLGGAMVTAKIAVGGVPPITVAAARFTLAALVLVALCGSPTSPSSSRSA